MAELQRAKRDSKAPLVRKIGNPSSRENLVMTSPTVRTSSVRTDSWEGGRASQCHLRFRMISINTFHIPLGVTLTSKLG